MDVGCYLAILVGDIEERIVRESFQAVTAHPASLITHGGERTEPAVIIVPTEQPRGLGVVLVAENAMECFGGSLNREWLQLHRAASPYIDQAADAPFVH